MAMITYINAKNRRSSIFTRNKFLTLIFVHYDPQPTPESKRYRNHRRKDKKNEYHFWRNSSSENSLEFFSRSLTIPKSRY